ncbi:MAG: hypothetical protein AAB403_11250 [Planctomycetota bacterium]
MAKPSPKPDDPEQSARFIALAQEVGAEGSPEEFGRIFRMVATATREAPKPKKQAKR